MAFIETPRFPDEVALGAQFGPEWSTHVVVLHSGHEKRNQRWTHPRHKGNVGFVRDLTQFEVLEAYFLAMKGRTESFRFKDYSDFQSSALGTNPAFNDQNLGNGDGADLTFQLVKLYTTGALTYSRQIDKPVSGTELVGVGPSSIEIAVLATLTPKWSIDSTTGLLTFVADVQKTVTGGNNVNPVELTVATHGLVTGDTVHLSLFTGDWAALNATRNAITKIDANTFSVAINGSGFAAYAANAGQFNTLPQTGERVVAGFDFDVPVRFDADHMPSMWSDKSIRTLDVPIVEIRI